MKVLVAVKRTIDANVKVRVKTDHTGVDLTNAKMAMNPFCEIAVEEAVRLKEKGIAQEVVAVTIGDDRSQEQLRGAMALGVDRGILVKTESLPEPLGVAKILRAIVEREKPDLILLGKQSIDSDNNQTGQMLAALCGYPQGTFAFRLTIENGRALVSREVDGGEQTVELRMPAVVTADLRLNEPRYAKLPDIMKAKKKPIDVVPVTDLGLNLAPRVKVLSVNEPAERAAGAMVSSAAELVDKLRNVAKVLP